MCIETIGALRMEKTLKKGPLRSQKFIPVKLDHPVCCEKIITDNMPLFLGCDRRRKKVFKMSWSALY